MELGPLGPGCHFCMSRSPDLLTLLTDLQLRVRFKADGAGLESGLEKNLIKNDWSHSFLIVRVTVFILTASAPVCLPASLRVSVTRGYSPCVCGVLLLPGSRWRLKVE